MNARLPRPWRPWHCWSPRPLVQNDECCVRLLGPPSLPNHSPRRHRCALPTVDDVGRHLFVERRCCHGGHGRLHPLPTIVRQQFYRRGTVCDTGHTVFGVECRGQDQYNGNVHGWHGGHERLPGLHGANLPTSFDILVQGLFVDAGHVGMHKQRLVDHVRQQQRRGNHVAPILQP